MHKNRIKGGGSPLRGIALSGAIACLAWFAGREVPVIGGPVFGILAGILVSLGSRRTAGLTAGAGPGIKFSSKKVLQAAIILLGFEMNLAQVFATGRDSLAVMVFTIAAAFASAWALSRVFGLRGRVPVLISVGTAICGASAIAATSSVIGADDDEVASSVSTIFLFNVAAVFLFPALGRLVGLSQHGFGLWAGTAVNDTSSVVAAGLAYGEDALSYATVVKLTRTLLIIPIVLALSVPAFRARVCGDAVVAGATKESAPALGKIFPWFVLGFLTAALLRTLGVVGAEPAAFLGAAGKFLIVMAMSAIGLGTDLVKIRAAGWKPILLGMGTWFAVAATSLAVQAVGGYL